MKVCTMLVAGLLLFAATLSTAIFGSVRGLIYVPGAYMVHDQLHIRGGHQVEWLLVGLWGDEEAVFLENQYRLPEWLTLNGGPRLSDCSSSISENAVDPRIGALCESPHLSCMGSATNNMNSA